LLSSKRRTRKRLLLALRARPDSLRSQNPVERSIHPQIFKNRVRNRESWQSIMFYPATSQDDYSIAVGGGYRRSGKRDSFIRGRIWSHTNS
jgi:hypothetical protein